MFKSAILFLCLSLITLSLSAQIFDSNYEQQEAFKPFIMPSVTKYRSAAGTPTKDYWQNRADYIINAELNDKEHTITGDVVITYTNNSPDDLPFIWLQLDQNLFSKDSRGAKATPVAGGRFGNLAFDGGYNLSEIEVTRGLDRTKANYIIDDTRMQVRLSNPLKNGEQIEISMVFSFTIPEYGSDRMGRIEFKDGWIYELAQWYPRVSVYDDDNGWETRPYLGAGEFYCEYGNIEYKVTTPWNYILLGSGSLINLGEVLSPRLQNRLSQAQNSDNTVMIIDKNEIGDKRNFSKSKGTVTWHYMMENTRDVAFAASKGFIWDAARINLPSGKTAIAHSIYPKEAMGDDEKSGWERSTEYTKAAIELNSYWFEYPYSAAVNVAGIVGGMEYPGMSFCSWRARDGGLWGVTDHEFGHNWFPMIVGSNERLYPWMDEGFNTFINIYATQEFNNGEYSPRRASAKDIVAYLESEKAEPPMTYPDNLQSYNLGNAFYGKPAIGLQILRKHILGEDRFDYAFKGYINTWAFKHPKPWDFFRYMQNASGENLDWFWKGWFFNHWSFDQRVDSVTYVDGKPQNGSVIHISNLEKMVFPTNVRVLEKNGTSHTIKLPVEVWKRGNVWSFRVDSKSEVKEVELNPDYTYPDVNKDNNLWKSTE